MGLAEAGRSDAGRYLLHVHLAQHAQLLSDVQLVALAAAALETVLVLVVAYPSMQPKHATQKVEGCTER